MARLGLQDVWRETARRTSAQAPILFTVAAAFLLLPSLIVARAFPQLMGAAGKAITVAEIRQLWPPILCLVLIQLFGQLALIAIATHAGGETVGAALRRALSALPRVIVAGIGLMVVGGAAVILLAIVVAVPLSALSQGRPPGGGLSLILALLIMLPVAWAAARLSLLSIVAVAEGTGPLDAVRRSWRMTGGRVLPIVGLLLMTLLGLVVLQGLVALVTSGTAKAIDALLGANGLPQFIAYLLTSAVGSVASVYLTILLVVIWLRLRAA